MVFREKKKKKVKEHLNITRWEMVIKALQGRGSKKMMDCAFTFNRSKKGELSENK